MDNIAEQLNRLDTDLDTISTSVDNQADIISQISEIANSLPDAFTHPTYAAYTGSPSTDSAPDFGESVPVSQVISDTMGHVASMTTRNITIPDTLSNGNSTAGLIKTTSTVTSNSGYTACPVINGVPYYTHGTHVSYGASATAIGSTASAGSATTVSRSDHTHSLSKEAVTTALGYTPPTTDTKYTHPTSHAASMITGLATVATSGSYTDLSNRPTSMTPTAHNQASNTINAMTGYSKPSTTGAIATTDTLNSAIGKLEKALDGKQASGSYLTAHQTIKQDGVTGATVNRFGTCSTVAGTAAKTVSITNGTFALEAGARVTVKFTNANTASTPTLNVASKGAKNIFHKGAQITSGANKALLAGVCDFVYDGTQWHLVGNYIDTNTNDTNTTYDLAATKSSGNGDVNIQLTAGGSGSGTDNVTIKGTGATTVTTNASGEVLIYSPTYDTTSNSWRAIKVNGTQVLSTGTGTGALNFISGTNISIGSGQTNNDIGIAVSATPSFTSVEAGSFNATSDARLKENFKEFSSERSILGLPVYRFDFIEGAKNQVGCKAQDLQEICPELVVENDNGYLSIKESKIVYLLLEEVKKLKARLDELEGGKA